ncbi:MAG: hypothetical protein Aureis2KO_14900 [Aureisphaera sp.]
MSYLHTPSIHFSGDFLADVSTVNNDPAHYNNKTFKSSFQKVRDGSSPNGWWNPEGGAVFNFENCQVTQFVGPDGHVSKDLGMEALQGCTIAGAEGRTTGKMVDLDPQEQGSSELWAVQLRLLASDGSVILEGNIAPTAFRDLQLRQHDGSKINGQPLGATWTSVLENITWGEIAMQSPFFMELKNATHGNKLSVNLNSFGYYYAHNDGRFSLGRVLGSIGPWFDHEPKTFASCRRLHGTYQMGSANGPMFFTYSNFLVNESEQSLALDLGGSFPISDPYGTISFDQKLILGITKKPLKNTPSNTSILFNTNDFMPIGPIQYEKGMDWLLETCGVLYFNELDQEVLDMLSNHQVVLLAEVKEGEQYLLLARESEEGYYLRADNFVQRLDADQTNTVEFYALQWGKALEKANISLALQPPTPVTPIGPKNPISEIPGNNYPPEGLGFDSTIQTKDFGKASLQLAGNRIHNPRGYIDGQIYFMNYGFEDLPNDPTNSSLDSVFIHLRDYYEAIAHPSWSDIAAIMTQYGNLYPIMSKYLVDLSDPESVKKKLKILLFAFNQSIEDSMHMPVTRDLSDGKRKTICNWLRAQLEKEEAEVSPFDTEFELDAKVLAESPAAFGTELTDKQKQLKLAVQAKSGEFIQHTSIKELKF